jgi:hypothetical protein
MSTAIYKWCVVMTSSRHYLDFDAGDSPIVSKFFVPSESLFVVPDRCYLRKIELPITLSLETILQRIGLCDLCCWKDWRIVSRKHR